MKRLLIVTILLIVCVGCADININQNSEENNNETKKNQTESESTAYPEDGDSVYVVTEDPITFLKSRYETSDNGDNIFTINAGEGTKLEVLDMNNFTLQTTGYLDVIDENVDMIISWGEDFFVEIGNCKLSLDKLKGEGSDCDSMTDSSKQQQFDSSSSYLITLIHSQYGDWEYKCSNFDKCRWPLEFSEKKKFIDKLVEYLKK